MYFGVEKSISNAKTKRYYSGNKTAGTKRLLEYDKHHRVLGIFYKTNDYIPRLNSRGAILVAVFICSSI